MKGNTPIQNYCQKHSAERVDSIPEYALELSSEDECRERLAQGMKIYRDRAPLWCKYDEWTLEEAARLLSGILPKNDGEGVIFDQTYWSDPDGTRTISMPSGFRIYLIFKIFADNFKCLAHVMEILRRSAIGDRAAPKEWAEYARAKGLLPHDMYLTLVDNSPLLALLESNDATAPMSQSDMEPVAQPYSTTWLTIQDGAIAQFFNPRRNPDAKSDEVIKWINAEAAKKGLKGSQNIAEAIFTIIKPKNHDPKKKRDEPQ